jgi:hypothetical protein
MEQMENIRNQVQAYFNQNAQNYIPNFVYLSEDDRNHMVNIGTSIICTRHNIGYPGGSFVQSVVDNNLSGAFANADNINSNALKFYCMMMYNMPVTI